jgi:uncharacterized protein YjbI with pentapeptide repeats
VRNKIFILVFILSILFSPNLIAQSDDELVGLQREKLEIEISRLKSDLRFQPLKTWVGIFGGILGSIAVIWTVIYGLRTINQKTREQHLSEISRLFESLNSNSDTVRLGAARGLSQYADGVIDEITAALSVEQSQVVRKALVDTLYNAGPSTVPKILKYNSDTLSHRAFLIGRLTASNVEQDYIEAILHLTKESVNHLKNNFHVDYEYGNKFQRRSLARAEKTGISEEDALNQLKDLCRHAVLLTKGTSNVISRWLRKGRSLSWQDIGVDLSETNLYGVKIAGVKISNSLFSNCLMRHADLSNSIFKGSDFSDADLFNSYIDYADFSSSTFSRCHLRKVTGKHAKFCETDISETVFSEGDFRDANFGNTKAIKTKFRNTDLQRSIFDNCRLNESEFQQASLEEASGENAIFYGAKLIETNLGKTSMKNARFNGADLRGSKLTNADLEGADFSGANIKNADFRGSNLSGTRFYKCKGLENALFDSRPDEINQ